MEVSTKKPDEERCGDPGSDKIGVKTGIFDQRWLLDGKREDGEETNEEGDLATAASLNTTSRRLRTGDTSGDTSIGLLLSFPVFGES